MTPEDKDSKLVRDLEQRIEILENTDEAEFGSFTRFDHIILVVGALLIPVLALIFAR